MERERKYRVWVHGSGKKRMIQWEDIDAIEFCNDKLWYKNGQSVLLGNIYLLDFTGLHDKNGKEIYEGDILKCEGWKLTGPFPSAALVWHLDKLYDPTIDVVLFDKGVFGVLATKPKETFIPIWEFAEFSEVIGNKFLNPELIPTKE